MNPSILALSRLEFTRFHIDVNEDFNAGDAENFFPQLEFNFNQVVFELGSDLSYPDNEVTDPRHFTLMLQLKLRQSSQAEDIVLPYSVEIQGHAYVHFKGSDEGLKRFQAVRGTGYMMLYGAFREHIANFTGRSAYGVWFLPSPNFNKKVEADSPKDVENWEKAKATVEKKIASTESLALNMKKPAVGKTKRISTSKKTDK